MWHYEIDNQNLGPISQEEVIQLIRNGVIKRKTKVWKEGMPKWQKAQNTELKQLFDHTYSDPFTTAPAPPDAAPAPLTTSDVQPEGFKNPTRLTKWLTIFLYCNIGLAAIALWSDSLELKLLNDFENGTYSNEKEVEEAAEANDNRQALVGGVAFIAYITSGILFLVWIHRANYNARKLGAQDLQFTPGWCVGWFFVPFANLWKPYQAMKEIVKASTNPAEWRSQSDDPLVGGWWALFIISAIVSHFSLRLALDAQEINDFIFANKVDMIAIAVDIPKMIVVLMLVGKVYSRQMDHLRAQSWLQPVSPTPDEFDPLDSQSTPIE